MLQGATAASEVLLLLWLVWTFRALRLPAFSVYLFVAATTDFSTSAWEAREQVSAALLDDVFRTGILFESMVIVLRRGLAVDRIVIPCATVITGTAFAFSAAFDARFGMERLMHVRWLAFLLGACCAFILLSNSWGLKLPKHSWWLLGYFAVLVTAPVSQYFADKRTWGLFDSAIWSLKLLSISGWWWWRNYALIQRIARKKITKAKAITTKVLLWACLNIWPPCPKAWRTIDPSEVLKVVNSLR